MADLIAINDPFTLIQTNGADTSLDTSCLKREALMFNRICIPTLHASFFSNDLVYKQSPHAIEELQWLLEQGVVFEPEKVTREDGMLWDAEQLTSILVKTKFGKEDLEVINTEAISKTILLFAGIGTRMHTIKFRMEGVKDAYPVLNSFHATFHDAEAKSDVLEVVINELPVPDERTPWEQIIEFRSDPDSQNKFLKLKNWVNEIAQMKLNPNEVEDKLKSLISDYQAHMNIHKIKTRLDTLKTIVLVEAGFITGGWFTGLGVVSGIIGMITTPLYTIKQRQISLLEEEQKAPGKEIAYIVKARESF
jgi:hypothetical protein